MLRALWIPRRKPSLNFQARTKHVAGINRLFSKDFSQNNSAQIKVHATIHYRCVKPFWFNLVKAQ